MGKEIILVETVGVGQDEVDIVTTAHTTIIVLIPGMGDDIQAIKAGILEVADIFVINKADQGGLEKTIRELQAMLDMNTNPDTQRSWRPPIVATEAVRNSGVEELLSQIDAHKAFLFGQGGKHLKGHMRKRALREVLDTIKESVVTEIMKDLEASETFDNMLDDIAEKRMDPFTLCEQIMADRMKKPKEISDA
jgi:LAO/AO transport system kinase